MVLAHLFLCRSILCEVFWLLVRTTSSSESSRPWMLLPSRTACWCLLPLVWLNRCTSEVICKTHEKDHQNREAPGGEVTSVTVTEIPKSRYIAVHYRFTLPALLFVSSRRQDTDSSSPRHTNPHLVRLIDTLPHHSRSSQMALGNTSDFKNLHLRGSKCIREENQWRSKLRKKR